MFSTTARGSNCAGSFCNDVLAVERLGEGLPHGQLAQRRVREVQVEMLPERAETDERLDTVDALDLAHEVELGLREDDVDFTVLQGLRLLVGVGDERQIDLVELAGGAPVLLVAGQGHALAGLVVRHDVRTTRDHVGEVRGRRGLEAVLEPLRIIAAAFGLEGVLRQDGPEEGDPVGVRLGEGDRDGAVRGTRDSRDVLVAVL